MIVTWKSNSLQPKVVKAVRNKKAAVITQDSGLLCFMHDEDQQPPILQPPPLAGAAACFSASAAVAKMELRFTLILMFSAISMVTMVSVRPVIRPWMPPLVTTRSPFLRLPRNCWCSFCLSLLRADKQEVKDHKDQNKGYKRCETGCPARCASSCICDSSH